MTPTSRKDLAHRRRPSDQVEERVLFDADVVDFIAMDVPHEPHEKINPASRFDSEQPVQAVSSLRLDRASTVSLKHLLPRQFVFVDMSAKDAKAHLDELVSIGEPLEIIYLDPERNAIDHMLEVLVEHTELEAIHLIADGSEGVMLLGSGKIDRASLALDHALALREIGNSLTSDGDLVIYGCDLNRSTAGQHLIDALARLTGTNVAASDEPPPSNTKENGWNFGSQNGLIQPQTVWVTQSGTTSHRSLMASHAKPHGSPDADQTLDSLSFRVAFENASCVPWEAGFSPHFDAHIPRGVRINGVAIDSGDLSSTAADSFAEECDGGEGAICDDLTNLASISDFGDAILVHQPMFRGVAPGKMDRKKSSVTPVVDLVTR